MTLYELCYNRKAEGTFYSFETNTSSTNTGEDSTKTAKVLFAVETGDENVVEKTMTSMSLLRIASIAAWKIRGAPWKPNRRRV